MVKTLASKVVLVTLLALLATETADARKRRHHRIPEANFVIVAPDGRTVEPRRKRDERRRGRPIPLAAIVPPGWQLQPAEPSWPGKRFTSPDGVAWFAIYKARADVPVSEHMKSIVFSDGETVTYVQGERSWIAAAGFKGSRMFYRKALLSCGGRVWHHVAFEYPIEMKDRMERFVVLAAEGLRDSQTDCDDAVAEHKR